MNEGRLDNISHLTGEWDYGELPSNVEVGTGCFIERKASFGRYRSELEVGAVLGDGVSVYTWTEFNIEPSGRVEVGSETILVGAVIMCAESVTIGARVVVSYNVTIADADFHPLDPRERRADAVATAPYGDRSRRPPLVCRPVVIEDDVWIGIGSFILKGVLVGAGAVIEPGSIVTTDVPAGGRVRGNPARQIASGSDPS